MSRFSSDLLARALAYVGRPKEPPTFEDTRPTADTFKQLAVETTIELCKRFEGFYSHPYLDPRGIPTIGYGATYYLDGRRVTLKDPPLSQAAAERLLYKMVETIYLPIVLRHCPRIMNPRRLAAIIDWTFNLGEGNLIASTLRRRINAEEWDLVPAELRRWVYAGGVKLQGLVLRRDEEARLI